MKTEDSIEPVPTDKLMDPSRRQFLKKTAATAVVTAAGPAFLSKYGRAAAEPINIGCIVSLTGYLSDQANNVVDGVEQAADELNQQGGVLGRPVKVLVRDDEMTTSVGGRRFLELVKNDNIVMHTGIVFGAVASIIEQTNKSLGEKGIVEFEAAASPGMQGPKVMDPRLFFIGSATEAYGTVGGEFMSKYVGKKTFILYADYSMGWQIRDGFMQTAPANGAEILGSLAVPVGATDFEPFLTQVLDKKIDYLACMVNGMMLVNCLKDAYALGLKDKTKFATFMVNIEEVNACGPEIIKDVYLMADYWWNLDTPKNKQFVERYMKRNGNAKRPSVRTFMHYASVMVWADVVKKVGTVDPAKVAAALEGFNGDYGKGLVEFRKTGDHTSIQAILVGRGKGPQEMKDKFDTQEIVKIYRDEKYDFTPKQLGWA